MKGGKGKGKQPDAPPGPPPVTQKDLFHRYNYTLQSSLYLQQLLSTAGPSSRSAHAPLTHSVSRKGKEKAVSVNDDDASVAQVARSNMRASRGMAVHNLLKLDPSLKRAVCRICSTVLVPGLTSRVRNKPDKNHGHRTRQTCLNCSAGRSIPAPPTLSSHGVDTLDGPVRARRQERLARKAKVAFHEFERTKDAKGHTLWAGSEPVLGWGVTTIRNIETIPKEGDTAVLDVLDVKKSEPASTRQPAEVSLSNSEPPPSPTEEQDEEAMMNG